MRTSFLLIILFLFYSSFSFSQNRFQATTFDNSGGMIMLSRNTPDSGVIMTGLNIATGNTLITKTDSLGNIEFCKILSSQSIFGVSDILNTSTGYLMVCYNSDDNIFFMNVDFNGNCQSTIAYSSPLDLTISNILVNPDGTSWLVANFYGATTNGFSLIRLDSNYSIISSSLYTYLSVGIGQIIPTSSNEFYLIGTYNFNPLVIKFDSTGAILWSKSYNIPSNGQIFADRSSDNGLIISTGFSQSQDQMTQLIKIDSLGSVEWNKIYTIPTLRLQGISMKTIFNSGYLISGELSLNNQTYPDAFLIRIDNSGNLQWAYKYGGLEYEHNRTIVQSYDGGYVFAGSTNGIPISNITTGYVVKTDSNGISGCYESSISVDTFSTSIVSTSVNFPNSAFTFSAANIALPNSSDDVGHFICSSVGVDELPNKISIKLFPNPINRLATFQINQNLDQHFELKIINSLGDKYIQQKISEVETELDLSNLPNGIYIYQLSNSENNFTGKFIVAH